MPHNFIQHLFKYTETELGCWVVPGLDRPYVVLGRGPIAVARMVCIIVCGEPNEGDHASHSCHNNLCINPDHISWQPGPENIMATPRSLGRTTSESSRKAHATMRARKGGHLYVTVDRNKFRVRWGRKVYLGTANSISLALQLQEQYLLNRIAADLDTVPHR